MKLYDFTGHLRPLPPGIDLPIQISGKVCLPQDIQPVHSDLIKLAAEMAQTGCGISDTHPPRATRSYWLREVERADDRARALAQRLADIAKRLSPSGEGGRS
jgi:hypothetical protein